MHFEVAGLFREAVGVGVRRTSHCKFLCVAKKKAEGACVIMCECVAGALLALAPPLKGPAAQQRLALLRGLGARGLCNIAKSPQKKSERRY